MIAVRRAQRVAGLDVANRDNSGAVGQVRRAARTGSKTGTGRGWTRAMAKGFW
jgi:hypothetical protein